jgi:hypothetical protein
VKAERLRLRSAFFFSRFAREDPVATDLPLREQKSELLMLQHGDEIAGLLMARGFESILVMAYDRCVATLEQNETLSVVRLGRQAAKSDVRRAATGSTANPTEAGGGLQDDASPPRASALRRFGLPAKLKLELQHNERSEH